MALTVAQATAHARSFLKVGTSYITAADELRISNTVNDLIVNSHNWSWRQVAGTDIAISAGTQDYSMAAADQNKVNAIATANLLTGTTDLPELSVGESILPKDETQRRPTAVCLLSETQIRLWPLPDATYTFQWYYYKRATEFAANTENWDIPSAMADLAKAGMIWQLFEFADDVRAPQKRDEFFEMLNNKIRADIRRKGRRP